MGRSRGGLRTKIALVDAAGLPLAPKGEKAWPPLAMFNALLLAIWHDLSDVALAGALSDRASFRRFCGFSCAEATPERAAFVRFRRKLLTHGLDRNLFEAISRDL
jgi:transposase, IS5 family